MLWAPRNFPRSRLYLLFTSTKPRHEGSQNMLPRRILAVIFFFFLVLQQQANINLMICCLLFMQNLRAQNLLLARCIRCQRKCYRRRAPYYWTLPRPVESWFEIHYIDRTIPGDYFRRLLRMNRESFDLLLNVIRNRLTRQNTILRNCLTPEKVLACGLLRLAHGNSYETIGPALNVGRTTAIDACQDVVEALFELRNEYIKFPTTVAETMRCIGTFTDKSGLPNVVGAIDGTHENVINFTAKSIAETLLHITCRIISKSKHPRFCFPRFVSVWLAPEVVDGIFEDLIVRQQILSFGEQTGRTWFFIVMTDFWHK